MAEEATFQDLFDGIFDEKGIDAILDGWMNAIVSENDVFCEFDPKVIAQNPLHAINPKDFQQWKGTIKKTRVVECHWGGFRKEKYGLPKMGNNVISFRKDDEGILVRVKAVDPSAFRELEDYPFPMEKAKYGISWTNEYLKGSGMSGESPMNHNVEIFVKGNKYAPHIYPLKDIKKLGT